MVACGYAQIEREDFNETFSPIIRHTTTRIIISIDVISHWSIRQLSVKNAFLRGALKQTVYMEKPPRFIYSTQPDHMCLL